MLGPCYRFALTAVVLFAFAEYVSALNFKISPKEELCFHEITHKGNKVLAFFDVLSWGYGAYVYLDVNAPTGRNIQKFEAESEGRVEFIAAEDGEHSFCFKNAYTETEVSFWVNTETDVALADVAKEGQSSLVLPELLPRTSSGLSPCSFRF
jgi:emp24/gp25L/p24 family/GOLD